MVNHPNRSRPYDNGGPALSVLGVSAPHARRAVKWLAARSLAAFYRPQDRSLRAFSIKAGDAATVDMLHAAVDATR